MPKAQKGNTVQVHYKGTLDSGECFDSSEGRPPIEFVLGEPGIIPGFQDTVMGMEPGEKKTRTIPAGEAYGPPRKELMMDVPRAEFPSDITPEIGLSLKMTQKDGTAFPVRISNVTDDTVTIDANHPLAGKDLTFEITLVSVK